MHAHILEIEPMVFAAPLQVLKTDPEVFAAVLCGAKTYEIRFNDRNFQVGDSLLLRETTFSGAEMKAGKPRDYTGREISKTVSHVLSGYGLMPDWVILSFAPDAAVAPRPESAADGA